jgi:lipid-A-disaccharide synthase-like uncharacterized protein
MSYPADDGDTMHMTRLLAGLLSGGIGVIAGFAVDMVGRSVVPDALSWLLPFWVLSVLVGLIVMAYVFQGLEYIGVVAEPPSAHGMLGLSEPEHVEEPALHD